MQLTAQRYKFAKDWTISHLLIDGQLDGYVVEDEVRSVKLHGETAIWEGTYPLASRFSPRFSKEFYWNGQYLISKSEYNELEFKGLYKPHELIWVQNVKYFQYILMHWGNTDLDSEGCLIVGSKIGIINGREGVMNSRKYYKKFYEAVFPNLKGSTLKITNQNENANN